MIGHLSGHTIHIDDSYAIIETDGVGYKVFATASTLNSLIGNESGLWIYTAIRENSHDLYGFLSLEEQRVFELLITISGIGPKTALNVLNVASLDTLRQAVAKENVAHLVKVSGIGKKIAEKIVLELRGKLGDATDATASELRDEGDAIEALSALGFSQKEARDALKGVPRDAGGTSERVKRALKLLSRNS